MGKSKRERREYEKEVMEVKEKVYWKVVNSDKCFREVNKIVWVMFIIFDN